jgi:hypothetical protein
VLAQQHPLKRAPDGQEENMSDRIEGVPPDHLDLDEELSHLGDDGEQYDEERHDDERSDEEPYDVEQHCDPSALGLPLFPDAEQRRVVEHRPTVEYENWDDEPDELPF